VSDTQTPAHTEHTMSRDLWRHFAGQNWAPLIHVPADMKHQAEADRAAGKAVRIIDMMMIRKARKNGIGPFDLLAVEIKVSRADFFTDVREPAKQEAWRAITHRHAYAVPKGMVRPDEVPAGSGLIEVGPGWAGSVAPDVSWKLRAPYSTSPELPPSLVMTFAYRAAQAEAQVRGLSWDTRQDEDPEVMRAELVRLRAKVELQDKQLIRARDDRDAWRTAFAATSGVPCATCSQPVRPKGVRSGQYTDWRHVDKAHDPACRETRYKAAEAAARARWDGLSEETRARRLERHTGDGEPWRQLVWFDDRIEPADIEDEEAAA
jgi:hypothetical protein